MSRKVIMVEQNAEIQGIATAKGLSNENKNILSKLLAVYNDKIGKNQKKWQYYKDEHSADNLGISVPQNIANYLNTSVGWCAKSVDMLAQRSTFDGFVIEGDSNKILDKIMLENDFKLIYEMAVPTELVYGCGFWTVTAGDDKDKIPVVRYYDAKNAAALWDYDNRRILAGFCITNYSYDIYGQTKASRIVLHTKDSILEISRERTGSWEQINYYQNKMGRPLMEAMSWSGTSTNPLGKSRISPAMMGITDEMQREILRAAITSELFSAPMRAILGASDEKFMTDKERLYYERLWTIEKDEDGDVPSLQEFKQASMSPHIEMMRNLASRMAAEASIPVNSLGIIHDNPSSAEALRASMEDLCMLAENLNRGNNRALQNVARLCLAVNKNISFDKLSDEEKAVSVCFKNPYTPSIASQTDAMIKQASMANWLVETEIYWEMLGYNDEQRKMLMQQKKQAMAESYIRQNLPNISQANSMQEYKGAPKTTEELTSDEVESGNINAGRTELIQE